MSPYFTGPPPLVAVGHTGKPMLLASVMVLLAFASLWMWWKLSSVQDQNIELLAEVARLRARLRANRR
ncbi:MAG: hypothetical protein ACREV5_06330 [Steroidobacter sp.]